MKMLRVFTLLVIILMFYLSDSKASTQVEVEVGLSVYHSVSAL